MSNKMDLRYEITGEHRPPKKGEWFIGHGGMVEQAWFDFNVQCFDIAREVLTEIKKVTNERE